jgi:two-component system sensor histidine kinase KdpD
MAGALGTIGLITVCYVRVASVNSTTVALTFLMAILGIATVWGLPEAIVASIAAVMCFNYFFLPPVSTFTIADPQNWVALVTFLVTSVVASQLSARAKRRAMEATRGQHEMERLYALSRNLMLGSEEHVGGRISYQIVQVFDAQGVALYDRSADVVYRAGSQDVPMPDERLRDAAVQGTEFHDAEAGTTVLPIRLGGEPIVSLAITGGGVSDTALHSIANLAAIELERARAQQVAARAEAARQNDELKATLLDALAHDFKTPLTSMKAAITAVLADAVEGAQKELLTVANEETDRLTSMVSEAIQMARIEAGDVRLEKSPRAVGQLVESALRKLESLLEGRAVRMDIADEVPPVEADADLAALAIRQVVDNALKYSPPGSPIVIRARQEDESVVVGIADLGPGVPEGEQSRIFEKFYRGRHGASTIPGTGMGLPIAREIIHAHGGRIWVESRGGKGSEFFIALPCGAGKRGGR